jgi:putative hydrolase of the HAD superfamily
MIKAVFFDLYFTLVGYKPSQEEVEAGLLRKLGFDVKPEALRRPFSVANEIIYEELIPRPASRRSKEEMTVLYAQFHRNILKEAGIAVGEDVINALLTGMLEVKMNLVLFDDVLPALDTLKKRGLTVGLISNIERNMSGVLDELGLSPRLDVVVTSVEAGANKPRPEIFRYALRQAGVRPPEAIYVGDQYRVDVLGARGAGLRGILLDRYGHHEDISDCPRIKTLTEVGAYL